MKHIILHTLEDTLKLVPFLFIAFLIIEVVEHKLTKKNQKVLVKSKKYGPFFGGLLGMIPQCGFSAIATNLFSSRVITVGTLIAVYLSTSDEMFMILLSGGMPLINVIITITIKACIGILCGLVIDLFIKHGESDVDEVIDDMCHDENCHCNENLFIASLKHTLNITLYILIATLIINLLVHHLESEMLSKILFQGNFLSYFIASLIGLVPNCASSIMISELYINNIISFGNMMSGLLTASGVGILILFKTNKHLKQNFLIMLLIYIIGVVSGIIIDLLGIAL